MGARTGKPGIDTYGSRRNQTWRPPNVLVDALDAYRAEANISRNEALNRIVAEVLGVPYHSPVEGDYGDQLPLDQIA